MKFTFTKNWNSNKAGSTENLPAQLANMLEEQGYGKIEGAKKHVKEKPKTEAVEETKEVPKSNAKPS